MLLIFAFQTYSQILTCSWDAFNYIIKISNGKNIKKSQISEMSKMFLKLLVFRDVWELFSSPSIFFAPIPL